MPSATESSGAARSPNIFQGAALYGHAAGTVVSGSGVGIGG
jgi:hypothetical protein